MKNKYSHGARISEYRIRELVKHFAMDIEASKIAFLTGLNRNTVNRYLNLIRIRIAEMCEHESPLRGEVEVEESYFGPKRIKGKMKTRSRWQDACLRSPSAGRQGLYTEIVPDCAKATLQVIIRGMVDSKSVIHSDSCRGYDGLVDPGYKKHYRVQHGADEFVQGKNHINGTESFWAFAKARLIKFNGLPNHIFYLHLKEEESGRPGGEPEELFKAAFSQFWHDISDQRVREPLTITQNNETKAVLQDVENGEQTQETMALLKILALGARRIEEARLSPLLM